MWCCHLKEASEHNFTIQHSFTSGTVQALFNVECESDPGLSPHGLVLHFPVRAVHVSRVLLMHEMLQYEKVNPEYWTPQVGKLLFVSHQWTSFNTPDHTGCQFKTLKHTLLNLVVLLNRSVQTMLEFRGSAGALLTSPISEQDYSRLHIWLDYWSIPQEDLDSKLNAIHSIPAYIDFASACLIVTPSIPHKETGLACDYESWKTRGWCRLERFGFCAMHYTYNPGGFPTLPVILTSGIDQTDLIGIKPEILSLIASPRESVFNGVFSCCQRNHEFEDLKIACDRIHLSKIVEIMWNKRLGSLLQDNVQTWRRNLALSHVVFAGSSHTPPLVTTVEEALSKYKIPAVTARVEGAMNILFYAVYENNLVLLERLVAARADVEAQDAEGNTPLNMAVFMGVTRAAVGLLDAKADPDSKANDVFGFWPLLSAAHFGRVDMAATLIKYRADVNKRVEVMTWYHSWTALHMVAGLGDAGSREQDRATIGLQLLHARADAGARTSSCQECPYMTPLEVALQKEQYLAVCALTGQCVRRLGL